MTVPAARPSTRDLFRQAVELVRSIRIEPAERPPAFTLPRPAPVPRTPGRGEVTGLPGDIWDTGALIRSGYTTVDDVVARASGRIAAYDRAFGAFEAVADVERDARVLAVEASSGAWRGPLHGIPITVKDVIDVAGLPTTGSSTAIAPRTATLDPVAVARLRAAGAVIVGKVATHEFALGVTTPQARNPWSPERVPGGLSGGSAISLVTGMALGSLGTDTRASIRVPAALMGLVGFKPSLGLVPTDRWLTLSWTMDHFAPMARSVRDAALLMDVLTGQSRFTAALPGALTGLRVGYSAELVEGSQPGVRARFDDSLALFRTGGATVREVDRPNAEDLALANAAGLVVSRAEAATFHGELGTTIASCTPEVRAQLEAATQLTATDYVRGLRLRGHLRERLERVFDEVDILVMPTSQVTAPLRSEADDYLLVLSQNCIPWSFVDFPAISVHAGLSDGLPVGVQLVAPPGQDEALLSAAHAFERLAPEPPLWSPT